jgi:capsular polysaccharide export protein
MKIICFSTLDKFSRFYLDIERIIKANFQGDTKVRIYSLYLSGFLYPFIRFKFSSWIAYKAWRIARKNKNKYRSIITSQKEYKGLTYNDFIKFHVALDKTISTESLQLQVLAYIDILSDIYTKFLPDYIISIGDSRMCIEIGLALAKQKNIKIYYIEQGPFNTTFFDEKGVNANLSIREDYKGIDIKAETLPSTNKLNNKTKKYNRSPFYRGLDIVIKELFEKTSIYPPDLIKTDVNSYKSKRRLKKQDNISKANKQIYLLILQIPLDVNMICHSPLFKSHLEIITSVYNNLPSDVELIIREHPLYINKYEASVYDFIAENNISIDNATNIDLAIDKAKVIIVNNSTVGIEAILRYKTVVILGNAFYDDDKIALKLKQRHELKTVLEKALNYSPNKNYIDNFKVLLFYKVLLAGTVSDKHLTSSKSIANYILEKH